MTHAPAAISTLRWSGWPQLVVHQAGWWACVIWMGWLGPTAMLGFIGAHLFLTRARLAQESTMVVAATLIGIILDSSLSLMGAVSYVGDRYVWASPLWLVAIWAGFGATLMHSQAILVRTRLTAFLTGALGGPAAYWGGERLERMSVMSDLGWAYVSASWTVAIILLHMLSSRLQKV